MPRRRKPPWRAMMRSWRSVTAAGAAKLPPVMDPYHRGQSCPAQAHEAAGAIEVPGIRFRITTGNRASTPGTGQGGSLLTVHRIAVIGRGHDRPLACKSHRRAAQRGTGRDLRSRQGGRESHRHSLWLPAGGVCELEDFISREDVHVVAVTTPSGAHGKIAEMAARHRKYCIVEKPIEVTRERIDRVVEAPQANLGSFSPRWNAGNPRPSTAGKPGKRCA